MGHGHNPAINPEYDGLNGDDPDSSDERVCRCPPMTPHSTILVYGRDPLLLETRSWVLEEAGFAVVTSSSLVEAEQQLASPEVKLLVLCHTLSAQERTDILAVASRINPSAKRLLLTASTVIPLDAPHEAVLSALEGPRALISTVRKVLSST